MGGSITRQARPLTAAYVSCIRRFLSGARGQALSRSHALGGLAGRRGCSAADLLAIHHRALAEVCGRGRGLPVGRRSATLLRQVSTVLEAFLAGYADSEGQDRAAAPTGTPDRMGKAAGMALQLAELGRELDRLRGAHGDLEDRMRQQTAELTTMQGRLSAEVTERKLTEDALRASEDRFRVIFDRAGLGIALLDNLGRIRESNPALRAMLGYTEAELHGRTVMAITAAEDFASAQGLFRELAHAQCTDRQLEMRFMSKAGEVIWVHRTVSGVYERSGALQFAIDLIEDVTERKRAEQGLQESEARFRQIADMTGEWIWEQDIDGRYSYSSAAVRTVLGYDAEEILGKFYYELFTPEDRRRAVQSTVTLISRKETFHHLTNRYRHKNGHEVYTESSGTPILDRQGNLLKWRGVDHDITERKRFEDALRLRDRAIEATRVGVIITDPHLPNNPIIYANSAFIEMTGYARDEVMGRNPGFLQGPETDPAALEDIRLALRSGDDCHLTLKNYRKDGTPFWNELLISPVLSDAGQVTHYIGIQTDVTELRRVEEERHELEIAKKIQSSLLPSSPLKGDGVLIAGYCLPATHVGGDYYDYFSLASAIDIVIADVSGHSVSAAMIMADARTTLKMETRRMLRETDGMHYGVGTILSHLNGLLFEDLDHADTFITMFYARFETSTRTLSYANAGHNRPLLLRRAERGCTELDAEGLILGVKPEMDFEERRVRLGHGDTLVFYTDGITEAQNAQGEFFGQERLGEVLLAHAGGSCQEIMTAVMSSLEEFCQTQSFNDDISIVVLLVT